MYTPLIQPLDLLLNGKTIGEENASAQTKLTATFNIVYQPGLLKAIALQNGVAVDSVILQTAGSAEKIKLTADRNVIHASRNDLSYVTAEIVDANGHLVPDAVMPLEFSIKGAGEIIATATPILLIWKAFNSRTTKLSAENV